MFEYARQKASISFIENYVLLYSHVYVYNV